MAFTGLGSPAATANRNTNGTSTTTSAFSVTAGDLILARVSGRHTAALTPTYTDSDGNTYTDAVTMNVSTVGGIRLGVGWVYAIAAHSGSFTFTMNHANMQSCNLLVWVIPGGDVNTSSPVGAKVAPPNSTLTTLSATLDAAPVATNYVLAAVNSDSNFDGADPGDTGGFSEVDDRTGGGGGTMGLQVQQRTGSTSTTVDWKNLTAGQSMAAAFELKLSGSASRGRLTGAKLIHGLLTRGLAR